MLYPSYFSLSNFQIESKLFYRTMIQSETISYAIASDKQIKCDKYLVSSYNLCNVIVWMNER